MYPGLLLWWTTSHLTWSHWNTRVVCCPVRKVSATANRPPKHWRFWVHKSQIGTLTQIDHIDSIWAYMLILYWVWLDDDDDDDDEEVRPYVFFSRQRLQAPSPEESLRYGLTKLWRERWDQVLRGWRGKIRQVYSQVSACIKLADKYGDWWHVVDCCSMFSIGAPASLVWDLIRMVRQIIQVQEKRHRAMDV